MGSLIRLEITSIQVQGNSMVGGDADSQVAGCFVVAPAVIRCACTGGSDFGGHGLVGGEGITGGAWEVGPKAGLGCIAAGIGAVDHVVKVRFLKLYQRRVGILVLDAVGLDMAA